MKRFVVGGCAALLVAACSQDPSLYLGGPPGPTTKIQMSAGRVALTVGQSTTVGASALDEVGNVTPDVPTFTSCGGPVSTGAATPFGGFAAATTIDAAASTVGETCVLVSAGGRSDSIRVAVGPAGLSIAGPDTVISGQGGQFTATGYDANGAEVSGTVPLEWSSSNEVRMITTFEDAQVTGRSPGSVVIRARAPNGVNQGRTVIIKPDVFAGTLSANTGDAGSQIIATRGPGDDEFDANATVTVGGVTGYFEILSPSTMLVAIPASGIAGANDLDLLNLGQYQTAKRVTFTKTTAFDDFFGATTDTPDTTVAPRFADYVSPAGYVYFTHSGFGTGSAPRGLWNGGAQQDHFFQFTTGGTDGSVVALLQWTNAGTGADFDMEICKADGTGCAFWISGSTSQELGTAYALAANTTYTVMASSWTSRNNIHDMRLKLTVTGTTIQ